jgi:hypothetical protein
MLYLRLGLIAITGQFMILEEHGGLKNFLGQPLAGSLPLLL